MIFRVSHEPINKEFRTSKTVGMKNLRWLDIETFFAIFTSCGVFLVVGAFLTFVCCFGAAAPPRAVARFDERRTAAAAANSRCGQMRQMTESDTSAAKRFNTTVHCVGAPLDDVIELLEVTSDHVVACCLSKKFMVFLVTFLFYVNFVFSLKNIFRYRT